MAIYKIMKKNWTIVSFDKEKIFSSIQRAVEATKLKKEVDVELSFEKPLPRKQEKGRGSSRANNRRRRSDNRDRKPKNERRSTDKKFFDKKGRRMQNK